MTIDERRSSERRNSRSSGEVAIRRSSSSRIRGHHCGMWRQLRSNSHQPCRQRRRPACASAPRSPRVVAAARAPGSRSARRGRRGSRRPCRCRRAPARSPRSPGAASRRAAASRRRRRRPSRAAAGAPSGRATAQRSQAPRDGEGGPERDQRPAARPAPARPMPVFHAGLAAAAAIASDADRGGRGRAGDQRGDERGGDVGADDRRRLLGQQRRRRRRRSPASRARPRGRASPPPGSPPALNSRNLPIVRSHSARALLQPAHGRRHG